MLPPSVRGRQARPEPDEQWCHTGTEGMFIISDILIFLLQLGFSVPHLS